MIYAKTNPIGLDSVIASVQSKLMALATTWNVELDGYPRCYPKHDTENGKKGIEHYDKANEYSKNLIHAEGNKFFFTAENDQERVGNGYATTELELYFIVDVSKCKPTVTHRADNEVRVDVQNILETVTGIEYTTTIIEIDKVFSGYDFKITDDMQPYHAFRIDLTAFEYDINAVENCDIYN